MDFATRFSKHLLTRDQASVQGSFEANLPPRAGSAHCYAAAALGSWTNKGSRRLTNSLKWRSGASSHDDAWGPQVRALLLCLHLTTLQGSIWHCWHSFVIAEGLSM